MIDDVWYGLKELHDVFRCIFVCVSEECAMTVKLFCQPGTMRSRETESSWAAVLERASLEMSTKESTCVR